VLQVVKRRNAGRQGIVSVTFKNATLTTAISGLNTDRQFINDPALYRLEQ
jgi:hypothetical protein